MSIMTESEQNWPEDEANGTFEIMRAWRESGDTEEQLAQYREKEIFHWRKVFLREDDGLLLLARYKAELSRLEGNKAEQMATEDYHGQTQESFPCMD